MKIKIETIRHHYPYADYFEEGHDYPDYYEIASIYKQMEKALRIKAEKIPKEVQQLPYIDEEIVIMSGDTSTLYYIKEWRIRNYCIHECLLENKIHNGLSTGMNHEIRMAGEPHEVEKLLKKVVCGIKDLLYYNYTKSCLNSLYKTNYRGYKVHNVPDETNREYKIYNAPGDFNLKGFNSISELEKALSSFGKSESDESLKR